MKTISSRVIPYLVSLVITCAPLHAAEAAFLVKPITAEQAAEYKLDPAFYKKGTLVQDILIATSDQVGDVVHQEAAYLFDKVMGTASVREALLRGEPVDQIIAGFQSGLDGFARLRAPFLLYR